MLSCSSRWWFLLGVACVFETGLIRSAEPAVVQVAQPVVCEMTDYEDFVGRLNAVVTVEIRTRVTGYVERSLFKEGEVVNKGDVLFEIDPRPYQARLDDAQAKVALAKAQLRLAKATLDRDRGVAKAGGAVSQQQLDQDQAAVEEASARVAASETGAQVCKLDLAFTKVVAPISGRIGRRYVDPGNLVKQNDTTLTTIFSIDPVYAYFDMGERTFLECRRRARGGLKAGKVLMGLANDAGLPRTGIVDFVDPSADPKTGTIRFRAVFANPDKALMPGLFARIRLSFGEPQKAVLVSESAVVNAVGKKYIWVLGDKDVVHRREVTTGPGIDSMRVIRQGLKPTEWVVVAGTKGLQDGDKVAPQQVMMPMKKASKKE